METILKGKVQQIVSISKKEFVKAVRLISLFIILFCSNVSSQVLSPRQKALNDIQALKNGVLLVRLATGEHVIKAYKDAAREDLALEIASQIAYKNKLIASAFKNYFTFCPVYFFYSNYSEFILNNQLDNLVIMNAELIPEAKPQLKTGFYIAEFARIEADTTGYWEFYRNKNRSEEGKREAQLYAGGNSNISALIIKSDKFVQLKKPFPYFVKYRPEREQEREINPKVKMLNEKLLDFYAAK